MAVHAAVFLQAVVGEHGLVEVFNAALLQLDVVPNLVVGFDEAVGEPRVELVLYDMPAERLVLGPSPVFQRRHADGYFPVLLQQLAPFVFIEDHFLAAPGNCQTANFHADRLGTAHQEVERGNVHRNGDVGIVGIDGRQGIGLLHVLGRGAACHHDEHRRQQQDYLSFHSTFGFVALS